jgi:Tol biopolymer transport system component
MKVRLLLFALVLTIIILGIGIAYVSFTPNLVSVSPHPNETDVLAASPVRLMFSRTMQADTVEERLSFTPTRTGQYTWEDRTLTFTPDKPWINGEKVSIQLEPGARSTGLIPLPMHGRNEWTFTIGHPLLLYLFPMNGVANLFVHNMDSAETQQLTNSSSGLLDFSASPDGRIIYFSERNGSGGSDIFLLDRLDYDEGEPIIKRLLACSQAFCHSPQVSPDSALLAFEREPLPGSDQFPYSQVWLMELSSENDRYDTDPVQYLAGEAAHPTRSPTWSSTGWLSYYDLELRAFILLHPTNGKVLEFSNDTGEPGAWSPGGDAFVAPEIVFTPPPEGMDDFSQLAASHLMRFDLATQEFHNLSQGLTIEDTFPSFSPNGSILALTRKFLDEHRWTPGRQIWIMAVESGETQSLTDSPSFNHFSITWSPEGNKLAYLRFNLDHLTDPGELWVVKLDSNEHVQIIAGGYSPLWIP